MIDTIKDKSLDLLKNIYETLDQYNESENRPQVFSMRKSNEEESSDAQESKKKSVSDQPESNDVDYDKLTTSEKFKYLTFELIDIGLFQSHKGLEYI